MVEKIKSGLKFLVCGVWRDAFKFIDRRQQEGRRKHDRRIICDRRKADRNKG